MQSPELSISVGELLGIPRVALRGAMDGWHDKAVSGVLTGFRAEGTTRLVLDLGAMTFSGIDGATAMVNALRSVGPKMCVHVVASGAPHAVLLRAGFSPSIRLYSSTDEIADYLAPSEEYFTSRWMASGTQDQELPLAA